uniref:Uncharacterized protein n=1 Tax=Onchocerca volvulus TaxID=6282 RepID=A0A8R1XTS1_ONCVO
MMVGTIPLRLPTPPPPPPPPPPPSGIQVKPKNGSSLSGGTKWTLRTEARDGGGGNSMRLKAEGTIEIPKPQSVASLREQIARKLEVKMPSTSSPPSGSMIIGNGRSRSQLSLLDLNGQNSYISQHNDVSTLPHLALKTLKFDSNPQSSNQTALEKQLSVVHEPMERHVSCITPVPFNRTATLSSPVIISPNIRNIYSNNTSAVIPTTFSLPTIAHNYEENNDYTCSTTNDGTESSQLNDYQKLNPVKQRVDDRPQPSFLSTAASAANGTISFHSSNVNENATNVSLTPNSPVFLINGHNKDKNEMTIRDLEIPTSIIHDDIVPASNIRTEIAQEVESQLGASSSSAVTTSKPPFSKATELRTKMQSESCSPHHLQSEQQNQAGSVRLRTFNSLLPAPEREFKGTSGTIPRYDAHTENSSWYRTMFKKMHVVDQLGKLFHQLIIISKNPL